MVDIIPEKFTVKAHPALFEGEGRGEPKNKALLFQSTVNLHFQNAHKTLFQSTVDMHFQNAHKTQKTVKARTLCVYIVYCVVVLLYQLYYAFILKLVDPVSQY